VQKIRIHNASDVTYANLGRYFTVDASLGKHRAIVVVAPTYVRVMVQNASAKCWRGLGRQYANAAAAIAAYRTPALRQIIETITAAAPKVGS
jgi:hypothetical protein